MADQFEDIDDIILDADERMDGAIDALKNDLMVIRTGRASPGLVEHLSVPYYGTPTYLIQLAVISVPEPRLITVKPFSAGDIGVIQKAIQNSDLGITPTNDGKVIRLAVPPLTEDRRRELARQVSHRTEEARVAARNVRRDANDSIKKLEKDKLISEDEMHRALDDVQEMLNKVVERIDKIGHDKEVELMEV
ncbi:MAG: ribosome recycling factor [Anaerolineae bacterium]|nr:ribosome recycling factor [Anaerolineae bacterium]MCB9132352.1 ribosome recycling factor [Anaerolineales bacterium]MCB0233486.1 ribosome recycling factor [Anaerolineae bacterium]MCB0239496.1 ribosome recycling factor [Anaerolineae bacterium]MCB0244205.1 ribosome recycling factor [Anaerolineae bacterium]